MRSLWKKQKKNNPEGLNLVASILVYYPEIGMVSYEPKKQELKMSFELRGIMEEDAFHAFANFLAESIDTYHMLNGYDNAHIDISLEANGNMSFLRVIRDIATISRGELSIITQLVRENFADTLMMESPAEESAMRDPEMAAMQEEALDRMIVGLKANRIMERIVGVREDDRVMVYNR